MIRQATTYDARQIATIHVEASQAAYRGIFSSESLDAFTVEKREVVWRQTIEEKSSELLVAEEDGLAIGWVNFGVCRDADMAPSTAEIWALYVDPANWSKGVGRQLWTAAERDLATTGFTSVVLWVLLANERANGFYRAMGFKDEGARKSLVRGNVELVAIRLRRSLGQAPSANGSSTLP